MNDIYSFYQLISKFQIEIPVIQRDYAQGRKNPKAKDVRKSMVRSMVKSVTEDDSPLFLISSMDGLTITSSFHLTVSSVLPHYSCSTNMSLKNASPAQTAITKRIVFVKISFCVLRMRHANHHGSFASNWFQKM